MSLAAANRYARAFVDVITAPASTLEPAAAIEQLHAFDALVRESTDLRAILLTPAVPPARKRAVVAAIASRLGMARVAQNFLCVVVDHRRIPLLAQILDATGTILDERTGVVQADVTSAREMPPAQREQLRNGLSRLTGRQVRCEFREDAALVGGAVARIASTIYDGSVRGQLEALRHKLAG